jgi:hypothetical protein
LTGCTPAGPPITATPLPPAPTPTKVQAWPTPALPGAAITWEVAQVSMQQAEINDSFVTEFGSQRLPSPGQKFLWIQVLLENTGTSKINLPSAEHFSVLYAATELKPTYGHRQDHTDYTALDSTLFPGQAVEAWLRFDLPATAELKDLRFVFLPESAQVGASPFAPDYPWGGKHPLYVWVCGP